MSAVRPFVLCGGSGTRLWPLSRKARPKQFLKLFGEESLLQQALRRLSDPLFSPATLLCNADHHSRAAAQAREIAAELEAIVLEPVGRNTGPASAIAALLAARDGEDRLCLLLPSDHVVPDRAAFVRAIASGLDRAREGAIVTFGVTPDRAHTGYGYIETEAKAGTAEAALAVTRFVEKPSREHAESFLATGRFFWNAGIFLFGARTLLAAFESFAPAILASARGALQKAQSEGDVLRLDAGAYARADAISIDHAIMEKAHPLACVPLGTAWSDIGSWPAVWGYGRRSAGRGPA